MTEKIRLKGRPRQVGTVRHDRGNGRASVAPLAGLPAPEDVTADEAFDSTESTIEAVKDHVGKHPDETQAILDAERARGDDARSTLIDWLESQIEG